MAPKYARKAALCGWRISNLCVPLFLEDLRGQKRVLVDFCAKGCLTQHHSVFGRCDQMGAGCDMWLTDSFDVVHSSRFQFKEGFLYTCEFCLQMSRNSLSVIERKVNVQKELTWLFVPLETRRANISRFFCKAGKCNILRRDDPLVSSHELSGSKVYNPTTNVDVFEQMCQD